MPLSIPSDSDWNETSELPLQGAGSTAELLLAASAEEGAPELSERLASLRGFGPYRLRGVLGRGGMGAVFEVEHEQLGVRYALKTILGDPSGSSFGSQLERFRREVELNARLDHPGILRVHSADLEGRVPYLVVDLLRGGSLAERLEREERIAPEPGITLALQLGRALQAAHQAGVLHRDLKPENVMFDAEGAPRLVDFGLALEVGRETRLTQTGVAVGTPLTMAPEQLSGQRSETAATDVYGLAATIYWCLAGEPPLGADCENIAELIVQVLEHKPAALRSHCPDAPVELARLVDAGLSKEPSARPSLSRWIARLEAVCAGERPRRGVRPGRALALGALALGGGLLVWAQPWRPPETAALPSATPSQSPAEDPVARAVEVEAVALAAILSGRGPLSPAETSLAAARWAAGARLERGSLSALEARLQASGAGRESEEAERAALWALACLAADEPARGRRHARRGTPARELIDLDLRRGEVDPALVTWPPAVQASASGMVTARAAYDELLALGQAWSRERVQECPEVTHALAVRVLDRLQWTLGRLGFVLLQSERAVGRGRASAREALDVLQGLPERSGPGRTALELFVATEQQNRSTPWHYELRGRAQRWERELSADPCGLALYATLILRYGRDPERALRLGEALQAQTRAAGDLVGHPLRLLPCLVARAIEVEWSGGGAEALSRARVTLRPILERRVTRVAQKELYPALVALHLQRRDLAQAEACLDEAQAVPTEDEDHAAILSLLRLELRLARDPVGAAPALVRSLEETRGVFAEELGLRAHAKALAGLDPSSDLAELARLEERGWLRLGLPWHGFAVGRVIEGAAWWPGVPR